MLAGQPVEVVKLPVARRGQPKLKRDADGGLTLLIHNKSPGSDKEANWLPAPQGPFRMFLRLYWPKPEALDGRWVNPPLQRVG